MRADFKQAEEGAIPTGWQLIRLGELAAITDGTHQTPRYVSSGIPFFSVENVTSGDFKTTKFISEQEHRFLTRTSRIERGDILMTRIGSIGDCKLIDWDVDASFYVSLALLKVRKDYSAAYIAHYSKSTAFQKEIELHSLQSAIPKKINLGPISNVRILVPPRAEQRAIAEALSDVDRLLGALDRLIAKKRDLKQAAMQQLLTGQTRLPGFHNEWQRGLVREVISDYFCGPSPTCEERNITGDSEWGVLKTTAATQGDGWNWKAHKALPPAFWNKPHLELKAGDVIVTKAGPRHRVGIAAWVDFIPPRIIVSGKMIGLRPKPKEIVPLILASAISASEAQIFLDQRTTGMAESQVNFENDALLQTPIRFPTIEEQTAIAQILSDMDAELAALEQRRDKTRAIRLGMMQELLTGRTRLV